MSQGTDNPINYGAKSAIWSVDVSDDGNYMVATSGYPDLSISLFNRNAELLWRQETGGLSKCSAISENSEFIVTGIYARKGTGNILFYNRNGRLLWRYQTRKKIESVSISDNNEYIAVSSRDGMIYLFSKHGKLLWSKKTRSWNERVILFISKDIITAISQQGSFYFYNLKGTLLKRIETENIVGSAAMCGLDYVLAGYGDKTVSLIQKNGELAWRNQLNSSPFSVAASKSGKHIAIGLEDGRVLLSNRNGKLLWEYKIDGSVNSVNVSKEGECIVAGSNDFNLSVLAKSGKLLWKYKIGHGVIQKLSDENKVLESIVQAQSTIANAKLLNVVVADAEKLLEQAKEFEKGEDYKNALSKAIEARKNASNQKNKYIKERATDTISLAKSFIKDAEKSGYDIMEAIKILKRAETLFNQKEYENSRENAIKARDLVKEITEKSEVNFVKKEIKKVSVLLNEIKQYDIDISEPDGYLQKAKIEYKKGAFKRAMGYSNKAFNKATLLKSKFQRGIVLNIILKVQSKLNILKNEGVDVAEIEESIVLANLKLEKSNYVKAKETALIADEKVEELKKMSIRQRAASIIVNARHISLEAKNLGADISEVLDILEKAENFMENGEYQKAIDMAKKGISRSEELKFSYLSEDLKNELLVVKKLIVKVNELGADVSESQHLYREAEVFFENKEYGKSMELAKKSKESAKNAKIKFLEKGALEIIKKAQYLVVELKKRNVFIIEASEFLQWAIVNLQNNEHEKAFEFANKSIQSSKKSESEYKNCLNVINEVKTLIMKAKENKIETRESEIILNDSLQFLKKGNYIESLEKAKKAKENIIKAQNNFTNAEKIINLAKETINKFKNAGVKVTNAEKFLTDAITALEKGIYNKAVIYANSAIKSAEDLGKDFNNAKSIINEAKSVIEDIKNKGIVVKNAEEFFKISLSHLKKGEYSEAVNFAKKSIKTAKEQAKGYINIVNKINSCKAEVNQIKGFGVNVTNAEKLLSDAFKILKTDQEKALQIGNEAVQNAKNSYKKYKDTSIFIENKKKVILEIKNSGVDVTDADNLIEKSEFELKNGNYEKAVEFAENALKNAQNSKQRSIGENAINVIENTVILIKNADVMGANTKKANSLLKKAKFLHETESFQEALNTAKQANEEVNNCILRLKKANELVEKGILFHNSNRFNEAIQCFDEAISLNPHTKTYYLKAESLEKVGKYRDGIDCCEKVLIHEQNNEKVLYLKGIFLNHLRRFHEAIPSFSRALDINPKMALGWYNKGVALDEVGEHEEAVSSYKTALKYNSFPEGWYNLGVATYNCGRYEEALIYYDTALKIRIKYEAAWYNMGEAYRELKRFDEALRSFENALNINPYNQKAIKERENCLLQLGRT